MNPKDDGDTNPLSESAEALLRSVIESYEPVVAFLLIIGGILDKNRRSQHR